MAEGRVVPPGDRELSAVPGISSDTRNSLNKAGVTDFQLAPTEDKQGFAEALNAAKQSNTNGAAVDSKTPEELQGAVTFISPDGMAGGAVEPNGNITAVFKNANSTGKRAGIDIAFSAIAHGGDRLDCYGKYLVNTYSQAGMEPVARIKYTWGINPEMDAQVQRQLSEGDLTAPPDIYFMKRRSGVSLERAASDYAAGNGKRYSLEELDALPLFEGENAYDEALAYRDSLIQNTGNAEQRLPGLGDPVSKNAGIQNQELTDIDSGEGNFPESQKNFSQTKSQGSVNKVVGNSGKTFVDGKTPLNFTYAVMSADDIIPSNTVNGNINANYPAELQPRDRTRQSSKAQIADISANLNPALLEESATAQNGAPIVRDDGVVIGGNGRTLAILQAYDAGKGGAYADYIRQNAQRFGIDPVSIPENPILVRIANDVSDYADLARKLNASSTADYSATESGMTDADKITPDLLDLLSVNDDGDLNTSENKPFVSRFINDVVPSSERNSMFASDGSLSQTGLARIQQAVFAKAYGSTDLLARLSESLDNDSKNVTNALLAVAPKAAQINNDIANNALYNVDVVNGILNAVDLYLTAKKQDLSSKDLASQIRFDGKTWDAGEVWLAQYLQANKRSSKKIRDMFNALCDELEGYGDPNQVSLFGDNQIPSLREIYEGVAQKYENQTGADAGQPDYERFGERDSTFDRNGETGKNPLPVFEPGTESGGEIGNNESVNPSVGAAGRGFSWGGEGVAGQVVHSQSNTINNIDRQNLSGADMEIQGGEQSYTHERVSHAERLHEAENVLQTESMEEVMDRLAGKESSTWDADDVVAATTVLNRLTKAMNEIQDKSSDEYRTILLEKLRLADKIQSVATSSGQTLESFKALSSPDKALVSAQKSIKTAADNVEKENPKGFANDVRRLKDAIEKANGNEEEIRSAINNIFGKKKAKSAPVDQFLSILKSGTYSNDAVKEFVASKYGVMPLSTDQANQILTLVGEAEKLPANSKRRVDLETQAAAIAASNVQSSWQDKWDAWRYTAMLGNIRTNVKNAGGNISMALEARAKDVVLAAAEKAVDAISKAAGKNGIQRTTSVLNPLSATDRALTGKAFADADENVYRPLTSASEIFDIAKSSKGQGRVYQSNLLEGLRTASTRALEGGDYSGTLGMLEALDETKLKAINDWVKAGVEKLGDKGFIGVSGLKNNYAYSLSSYLKANGYDSTVFDFDTPETRAILEKARAHAIQQALVNTYHADSALADAISDFKRKLSNSESVGGRIAGKVAEGFLPFVKTPVNVINNAIHYSPISFLKLASLDVVGIKKGTKTANDALEDFAAGLTGTVLMAIGAWMYQKGFLVPGMDEDEAKQSKSTGRQEYSLRLPNEDGSFSNYGIDWFTSSAIPLFTGAEWVKLNNGEATGDFLNDSITSLSSIAEPVVNMSLMQGVENALSAVEYAETNKTGAFLSSAATSYVTQGIPTISGQISRGIDDTRRSTYSDKTGVSGDIAYTQNKIENKLPGLSMTNEPYIDPWGRTESNGGLLYNLLSPGYYSREEMTDVDKALDALYQESESASVLPSLADKKLKLDGEERNLTPEEYTEFATERGQTAYDLLGSLTGSDMFEDMSTEDQVEAVSSMYSLADALAADAQFGDSYEPSSTNQKLMDAYNASGTSGVVNYLSAKNSIVGTGAMGENGQRTVTQADKYRAYTNYSGSADEAIQNYLIAYPSDEKVSAVYKQFGGTAAQAWMKYKLQVDTNGNDSISQAEAKVWLSHSNLTQAQKAWFWQNTNTQWKASSNPFF